MSGSTLMTATLTGCEVCQLCLLTTEHDADCDHDQQPSPCREPGLLTTGSGGLYLARIFNSIIVLNAVVNGVHYYR